MTKNLRLETDESEQFGGTIEYSVYSDDEFIATFENEYHLNKFLAQAKIFNPQTINDLKQLAKFNHGMWIKFD